MKIVNVLEQNATTSISSEIANNYHEGKRILAIFIALSIFFRVLMLLPLISINILFFIFFVILAIGIPLLFFSKRVGLKKGMRIYFLITAMLVLISMVVSPEQYFSVNTSYAPLANGIINACKLNVMVINIIIVGLLLFNRKVVTYIKMKEPQVVQHNIE